MIIDSKFIELLTKDKDKFGKNSFIKNLRPEKRSLISDSIKSEKQIS